MPDAHYTDPRLAALYDTFNLPGPDTDFFVDLAGPAPARALEVGCGTGQLALAWAAHGHHATGVDLAPAMLDVARRAPGGGRVTWLEGDARTLDLGQTFDVIVMTGHVFQVFLTDADMHAVLAACRRHLARGGRLAFETRNPAIRAWEAWNPARSRTTRDVPGIGRVESFYRIVDVTGPYVTFNGFARFLAQGDTLVSRSTLRFPTRADVANALTVTGYTSVEWYGDWDRSSLTECSREIIVVAGNGQRA